ncbi:hypothetical protein [Shewanella kaireitica]|uniref:hypothetical protein n=1 Tax=Shewanella kaireitica TaxID=212021 RepID=UPI002010424D|nr:hypothetical protein [Shewanella kaireitica]MCL1095003.1 hypothetical protein [Shewanella kaireitica]
MLNDSSAYFSINHPFDAYLQAWDNNLPLPTLAQLSLMLPPSLQLISDIKSLESDCLLQLRHLDDEAKTVVEFLKLQSRKIDMVLQHVIGKEEYDGDRYAGSHFGGSSITVTSSEELPLGSDFKVSLHIKEELVALICFAKVQSCSLINNEDDNSPKSFSIQLTYSVIQDADVEQLVKASLSLQQKQLKLRKLVP